MLKPKIVLIAHNLRSAHNVGSLIRTAEGLGIDHLYLSGYTPYPLLQGDERMPHIAQKVHNKISKTALGAEASGIWSQYSDIFELIGKLRADGYQIAALEQTPSATPLHQAIVKGNIALIVGREVEGVEAEILELCDSHMMIPMAGRKESFNVAVAAAIALHHLSLKRDGQIGTGNGKI